ncbi:MAG: porin [Ahniella sp.]|nr:porin [Ahniella sp.]
MSAAVFAGLSSSAMAEMNLDIIGNNEISFEALIQGDYNQFDNDFSFERLDGGTLSASQLTTLGNTFGTLVDDNNMRRSEFVLKGKGPTSDWTVGYDFSTQGGRGKWLDVNYRKRLTADYGIRIGQFKQPNSLEELGSTRHNDFISKAVTTNAFGIARRVGVEAQTGGANWTLTGTWFGRELTSNLNAGAGFGARGTFAPIMDEHNTVHLGVSAIRHDTRNDLYRNRQRPDADLANLRLVDTGDLKDADSVTTLGLEAAWIGGPVKVVGEYMNSTIARDFAEDFKGDSWYVSSVWNVTGEAFTYRQGIFNTPLPNDPGYKGMYQLGLRYDTIDLDEGMVNGGTQDSLTAGVNWYWRQNLKVMLNYVMVDADRDVRISGVASPIRMSNDPNILEMRVQIML